MLIEALGIVLGGTLGNRWQRGVTQDLFDLKGIFQELGRECGAELEFVAGEIVGFVSGTCAEVIAVSASGDRRRMGYLGRVDEPESPMALYAGEMSYLDEHIGRLLDGLASRGILENAIVVITGDHGEAFWEHGDHWNHGLWVYDTTVRVPLIFHVPGNEGPLGAGTIVDEGVSTIDVVPTLLDLLHLESPKRVEGQSLVAALEGRPLDRGAVFSQATQPIGMPDIEGQWGNLHKPRCVRDGRWKFVHAPYNDYEELYDLEADPDERTNLLLEPDPPADILAVRDRLKDELTEWARTARVSPSHLNPAQFEESMKRLKSLGYAGDGK